MGMLSDLGAAIGKNVVAKMAASGQFDRIIDDAVAANFEKMAAEPRFASIRPRLLNGAARIREKQRAHLAERKLAFDALPWWKRWLTDFAEFCK